MKYFIKLFIVLASVFVIIGCASNKAVYHNDIIEFSATDIPEGILLTFNHIPKEAFRLSIQIIDEYSIPIFAEIIGFQLDYVKKSKQVICPFVQKGQKYIVGVFIDDGNQNNWKNIEITVNDVNGIYISNDITVNLINNQTGVRLSSSPIFSSEIEFAPQKYRFMVTVKKEEDIISSFSDMIGNSLTWNFIPKIIYDFTRTGIYRSGEFSAYVIVYCNVNYENISWTVEIAKSNEFTIYF